MPVHTKPSGQVQMSLYGLLKRPARQAPCPQGRLAGLTVEEELRAPDDGCGQLTPVRQSAPRMNRWMAHVRLRDKRFLTISVQYGVLDHETFLPLLGPLFGAAFRFWALSAAHDRECGHN